MNATLKVDRVMCTGHGNCAAMLPDQIALDEWGYPVLTDTITDSPQAQEAVAYCPARALYLTAER